MPRGWLCIGLVWPALVMAEPPAGDATRGAAIAASRSTGLCVLCHALPGVSPLQSGTLGPDLAGIGGRLTHSELRLRLLEPQRFNPDSLMPAYGAAQGLRRVAAQRQGQALLDAQQLEDVLAYLGSLQ